MGIQTIVHKDETIGTLKISWFLTENETFKVNINKTTRVNESMVKGWEFPKTTISEAVSFCWFEYVVNSVRQHFNQTNKLGQIPVFLKTLSTNDASDLIEMVLDQVRN